MIITALEWGVKNSDFGPKSRCISEKIQDRAMVINANGVISNYLVCRLSFRFNPLKGALKPHRKGPYNTVTGTLAVNGLAVTFGTARRGLGGLRPRPVPSSLYQM